VDSGGQAIVDLGHQGAEGLHTGCGLAIGEWHDEDGCGCGMVEVLSVVFCTVACVCIYWWGCE